MAQIDLEKTPISPNRMAAILGMSGTWFRQNILKETMGDKRTKGSISVADSVRSIHKYYQNRNKNERSKVRSENRMSVADIRAAKAARHLLEVDNVTELTTSTFTSLRAELEGVPALVTRDLELRKKINDAITAAFKRHHAKVERQLEAEEIDS